MLLKVLIIFVAIFYAAEPAVALLESIGFERCEAFDEDPLADIELSAAGEQEGVFDVLLYKFAILGLYDFDEIGGDSDA